LIIDEAAFISNVEEFKTASKQNNRQLLVSINKSAQKENPKNNKYKVATVSAAGKIKNKK
jgi:hypothetical protein